MIKVRIIFLRSWISSGKFPKPSFLDILNICHKIIADIHGDRPTENSERLRRFPPVIAVEKAKNAALPPKKLVSFTFTNGRVSLLPNIYTNMKQIVHMTRFTTTDFNFFFKFLSYFY